ncbi:hypothetical protein FT663_02378 [Candidozyma haemuli var. vulneris]|uniref:Uncharacterized protein n=1 Tax=Candidozyma haemuli TaxID=45357 RepID=A0A2V1AZ92_9ASCO|nr:hypothetical protein CXQ85_002891 [[Candida] haemuloni]KAF3988344.1 hypothetical protein FT662_03459 [[Candida] haemuloni var. vulneris]KAF3992188.1 hypothetical protein FT663_02378 [[Candida] haemuloni var. vulneris]PVH23162.1 hypothetical protein CXQ85_002891 [[Candida] haemuloni]
MNFLFLLSLISFVAAFDVPDFFFKRADTTSKTSSTIVYVTLTTGGKVITTSSAYSQSFKTTYSDPTASVPEGSAGLGSQTGEVGGVRSYEQTTISNNGHPGMYAGVVGWVAVAVGYLL